MTLLFHIALSSRCVGRASSLTSTMFHLSSSGPLKLKTPLKPHPEEIQRLSPQGNLSRLRMLVILTSGVHLKLPEHNLDINSRPCQANCLFNVSSPPGCQTDLIIEDLTHPGSGTHTRILGVPSLSADVGRTSGRPHAT